MALQKLNDVKANNKDFNVWLKVRHQKFHYFQTQSRLPQCEKRDLQDHLIMPGIDSVRLFT
jgi:hypothetical protein